MNFIVSSIPLVGKGGGHKLILDRRGHVSTAKRGRQGRERERERERAGKEGWDNTIFLTNLLAGAAYTGATQCLMRGAISQILKWIISHWSLIDWTSLKIIGFFYVNAKQGSIFKRSKRFLKLKQPCIEKHRPSIKCPPRPIFKALCGHSLAFLLHRNLRTSFSAYVQKNSFCLCTNWLAHVLSWQHSALCLSTPTPTHTHTPSTCTRTTC